MRDTLPPRSQTGLRILCLIHSLGIGGAERIAAMFAADWAKSGNSVTLVTLTGAAQDFYPLDPIVQRVRLDVAGPSRNHVAAVKANLHRIGAIRSVIRDVHPDVIVSFMDTATVLATLAATGTGIPVVGFEASDPMNAEGHRALPWRILRRFAYGRAAAIAVLSRAIQVSLDQWRPRVNTALIPNPVPAELLDRPVPPQPPAIGRKRIVALGRLSRAKGIDMLIEAFAPLAERFSDWDLWIWGEGEEREKLRLQIARLGLQKRVLLPGATRAPWDELAAAAIFVLPSRREGFPGALVEAMALGRACVAFDCMSGPAEIIEHDANGLLVPAGDIETLSRSLASLIMAPAKRRALGRRALAVRERYRPSTAATQWQALLMGVVKRRERRLLQPISDVRVTQ
jgi:glycosyltransferase involved in cell wall biosynthesis